MKRAKYLLLHVVCLVLLVGCTSSNRSIESVTILQRTDVFQEVTTPDTTPAGYADLMITASIKTPTSGHYLLQRPKGPDGYRLIVNIDGQPVDIKSITTEEQAGWKENEAEAGAGIRHRFSKTVRLKAGAHHVVVALPHDSILSERNITLAKGANTMLLEPVYRSGGPGLGGSYRRERFFEGLKDFRVRLNGDLVER